MSTIGTDGAFPLMVDAPNNDYAAGLTKREYMAAQIMAGFAAANNNCTLSSNAEAAVEWADALIEKLNN